MASVAKPVQGHIRQRKTGQVLLTVLPGGKHQPFRIYARFFCCFAEVFPGIRIIDTACS